MVKDKLKSMVPAPIRKSIQRYRRRKWPKPRIQKRWQELDFTEDVFFVSFPRSGSTWLRYIMMNLRFPDTDFDVDSLAHYFPDLYTDIDPVAVPQPRWIKTHLANFSQAKRVVYLIREGREVARSFYAWSGMSRYMSFDEFFSTEILDDHVYPWSSWHQHVQGWCSKVNRENFLLVRYEDLRSDPVSCTSGICSFLELNHTSMEIHEAVRKSNRESMQKDFDKSPVLKGAQVGIGGHSKNRLEPLLSEEVEKEFLRKARGALQIGGY